MPATVYGYIRLESDGEPEVDRLHDQFSTRAAAEGWALTEVFVDRNTPSVWLLRPGLAALRDAVRTAGGGVVLVASPDHLSTYAEMRRAVEAEIIEAGGRIVDIQEPRAAVAPARPVEQHAEVR